MINTAVDSNIVGGFISRLSTVKPQTQKAKALVNMKYIQSFYAKYYVSTLPKFGVFLVFTDQSQVDEFVEIGGIQSLITYYGWSDYFARPCPITPKHGFVESRQVKSTADFLQVWSETKAEDPQGEVILCSKINAKYNIVATPCSLTIGKGHDGATAGKEAINLPVIGQIMPEKAQNANDTHEFKSTDWTNSCFSCRKPFCSVCSMCATPGCKAYREHAEPGTVKSDFLSNQFGITNTPYMEAVFQADSYSHHTMVVTQLRDGPKIESTKDLIKADTVVTEIVEVDDSLLNDPTALLKWDKLISQNEGNKGFVVYHPGGSPACHFGVHCNVHDVPYITTFKPVVGQTIKKTQSNEVDYRLIREGLIIGLSNEYSKELKERIAATSNETRLYKEMVVNALYALHGSAVLGKSESRLLGFAIAGLIRLATGACLGELRHYSGIIRREGKKERHTVYREYIINIDEGLKKLRFTLEIFQAGTWGSGFGGKNWANCTDLTIKLVNAALRFHKRPTKNTYKKILDAFNLLINAVHNGGLFLNKFADQDSFNHAVENNAMFASKHAPQLYQTIKYLDNCELKDVKLCRQKLISNRLLKADQAIVTMILSECANCGESFDKCNCNDICGNCGELSNDCNCRVR